MANSQLLLDFGQDRRTPSPSHAKAASCSDWPDFGQVEAAVSSAAASDSLRSQSLGQPPDEFTPPPLNLFPKPKTGRTFSSGAGNLNGFIKHQGFSPEPPEEDSGNGNICLLEKPETLAESGSSSDEDDDVFTSARFSKSEGVSLLSSSRKSDKSKRRQKGGAGFVEDLVLRRSNSDLSGARVLGLGAESRRARLRLGLFVLVANMGLGVAVAVVVAIHRGWRPLGQSLPPLSDTCPSLLSTYRANLTTERAGIYAVGSLRLLSLRDKQRLLLLPYGSFCTEDETCPPGGVLAFYANTFQKAWAFESDSSGDVASLTCGADLDQDGVDDCALVIKKPWGVTILSGATGSVVLGWTDGGEGGWSLQAPLWLPDLNEDGNPDLLLALTRTHSNGRKDSLFRVWESRVEERGGRKSVTFVLPEPDVASASREKLVLKNASISQPIISWADGDGATRLGWTVDGVGGFLSLPLSSFLQARYQDRVLSGSIDAGPGFLADVDEDGRLEWVGCDGRTGALAALSLSPGVSNPKWTFKMKEHRCLDNSLSFGRDGRNVVQVGAYFQHESKVLTELVVVSGATGVERWRRRTEDGGVEPSYAPLSVRLAAASDTTGDWLLVWNQTERRLDLSARPFHRTHPHALPSHLYQQEAYSLKEMANDEEVKIAALLNERFTGTFFVSDGSAEMFFVNNIFDERGEREWRLMLHRLNVRCGCDSPPCGAFASFQPWSGYRGSYGYPIFSHP